MNKLNSQTTAVVNVALQIYFFCNYVKIYGCFVRKYMMLSDFFFNIETADSYQPRLNLP